MLSAAEIERVGRLDRVARAVERGLRRVGEPRLGVALLLVAAVANLIAAADARWRWLLDTPPYLLLVATILLTGIAAVALRAPGVWREWRRPAPLSGRSDILVADQPAGHLSDQQRTELETALRRSGYRVRRHGRGQRWQLAGVRRGWSRFAAMGSHLSLVVLVVGAALGTAFAEETRFGLFPGEQSLLAEPRPSFTAAVRFDRLDAAFDAQGRPVRFDTDVTFLREGGAVRSQVLQVNDPGAFDGFLVHAWTYGPAVTVRVTDLGGGALFDGWVALGGPPTGGRAPFVELPQLAVTIGLEVADAPANLVRAIAADETGRVLDSAILGPGERVRLGPAMVSLGGFSSYVTFLSRRDPGVAVLFAGAGLLVASLAVAFYLPRRRIDLAEVPGGLRLRLRGERFDQPQAELARLRTRLRAIVE